MELDVSLLTWEALMGSARNGLGEPHNTVRRKCVEMTSLTSSELRSFSGLIGLNSSITWYRLLYLQKAYESVDLLFRNCTSFLRDYLFNYFLGLLERDGIIVLTYFVVCVFTIFQRLGRKNWFLQVWSVCLSISKDSLKCI